MATPVSAIINNAKRILQELGSEGVRWTNDELAGWLNEFYQAAITVKPDLSTVNEELQLTSGTKQVIPADGLRLLDVIRNTVGTMTGITVTERRTLNTTRRAWHSEPATTRIEQFVFDDLDPRTFYVYPPADTGAAVEVLYSFVPEPHDLSSGYALYGGEAFKFPDTYAPAATDYLLYRAFSKDAETPANLQRAQLHFQAYGNHLAGKAQVDQMYSPNSPDASANPPKGAA